MKSVFKNLFSRAVSFPFIIILLLVILVYCNSLGNGFLNWDDAFCINSKTTRSLDRDNLKEIFTPGNKIDSGNYYRPVPLVSLALDFYIWFSNPAGFHLSALLIFLTTLLFMYLTVIRLFDNKGIAFVTVLLFAIHPVNTEVVNWISCRFPLLGNLFSFMSFYFFILFIEKNKIKFFILSLVFYIMSVLSQPNSAILVMAMILYLYCFSQKIPGRSTGFKMAIVTPYFIVCGVYAFLLYFFNSSNRIGQLKEVVFYYRLLTGIDIFGKYVLLIFWPFNLSALYSVEIKESFMSYSVILSFLLIIIFTAWLLYSFFRDREICFALGWIFLFYLPVSNIFFLLDFSMADRYLYFSFFGISLAVAILFHRSVTYFSGRKFIYLFAIIIVLILAVLSHNRNEIWKNSFIFWSDTVKKVPFHPVAHLGLALEYDRMGLRKEAIEEYKKVIALEPDNFKARINLAANYYSERYFDGAMGELKEALRIDPTFKMAGELLRLIYKEKLKEMSGSEAGFKAISFQVDKHLSKAMSSMETGNVDIAIAEFEEALALNPFCEEACYNLALLYQEKRDFEKAGNIILKFSELFPDKKKEALEIMKNLQENK